MARELRQFVLIFVDIILAVLALMATLYLRFWGNLSYEVFKQHLLPFAILYLVWFLVFYIFGLYDLNLIRPKLEFLVRLGECFLVCLGLGLIFFYLIPLFGITPKTNLLINIIIFGALILGWRRAFYSLFSSVYQQNVDFLGKNPLAKKLAKEIEAKPQLGYKFVKLLKPDKPLYSQLKKGKIDILIIAQDLAKNSKLTQELYKCLPLKISFMNLAKAYEVLLHKIPIDFINQTWFLENLTEGEKKAYDKLERIKDVVLAALLILITSPFWGLAALAIKLDDEGPVFYRQKRMGKDKKIFWVWKFRSMLVGAEKKGPQWAEKTDKRKTRVGRILRRTHIDELPQMLNVLKGDIALVGPRPERPGFVKKLEKEIPHYHLRHLIKPGFTGWAQTKEYRYARSTEDSHEKFQYDLYYIKNRSFFLDLGIFLKTFQLLFKRE